MWRVAICAVLLTACGGNDGHPLSGTWLYVGSPSIGVEFSANGTYTFAISQATGVGVDNAELSTGTYEANGLSVTFTPEQWTCAGREPPFTDSYAVGTGVLQLSTGGGLVVMAQTSGSGTVSATFGCFDAAGTFTAHPLGSAK